MYRRPAFREDRIEVRTERQAPGSWLRLRLEWAVCSARPVGAPGGLSDRVRNILDAMLRCVSDTDFISSRSEELMIF